MRFFNIIILRIAYLSIILLFEEYQLFGQIGVPLSQHYTQKEFKTSDAYAFSAVQDDKGNMYFGFGDGVVQYDGTRFNLLRTTFRVDALAIDGDGGICLSTGGEIGRIEPDSTNTMRVKTKTHLLKSPFRPGRLAYHVAGKVYFVSDSTVAVYKRSNRQERIHIVSLPGVILSVDPVENELWINIQNKGMFALTDTIIKPLKGLDVLVNKAIASIAQINNKKYICTILDGFYVFENNKISPFPTIVDSLLKNKKINSVKEFYILPDKRFVICDDSYKGIFIFDPEAVRPMVEISKATGYIDVHILKMFVDRESNLWVCHLKGITKFILSVPVNSLEGISEIKGNITDIEQVDDRLWIATNQDVYSLKLQPPYQVTVESDGGCNVFYLHQGQLLGQTGGGIYNFTKKQFLVPTRLFINDFLISKFNPNIALGRTPFQGTQYYLYIKEQDNWQMKLLKNPPKNLVPVFEFAPHQYFAVGAGGLYKIRLLLDQYKWELIDTLPVATAPKMPFSFERIHNDSNFVLYANKKVYRTNLQSNPQFEEWKAISPFLIENRKLFWGTNGQLYIRLATGFTRIKFVSPEIAVLDSTFEGLALKDFVNNVIELNNTIWVVMNHRLYQLPMNAKNNTTAHLPSLHKIIIGQDSVLYNAAFRDNLDTLPNKVIIDYDYNQINFLVAANSFINEDNYHFRFQLQPFNTTWTQWSTNPEIRYTNLPEGDYTLLLQSRNGIGQESAISTFHFTIRPPWYRQWWAYGIYLIGISALFWGGIRLNAVRLRKKNAHLEKIVAARTEELSVRNNELKAANAQLINAFEELKANEEQIIQQRDTLKQYNTQLEIAYHEIKQNKEKIETQQAHIIQQEKMAVLGQLIAGIAHEINTPIGAIRAANTNIQKSFLPLLTQGPQIYANLHIDLHTSFYELIQHCLEHNLVISSREERTYKKEITTFLETYHINNAALRAQDLVKAGIYAKKELLAPFLQLPNAELFLDFLSLIGRAQLNTDNIQLAVEKTQKIIFALKSYSHQSPEDTFEMGSVTENLEIVLMLYSNQIRQGIDLITQFEENLPLILMQKDQLNQVWTNIIHNAMQAMNYSGKLEIKVYKEDMYIVVKITDNGPGIPPEVLPRIFDAFYTTKKQGEGTGLGLDISRKIVEKHGGSIRVASVPGETSFFVYLPQLLPKNTLTIAPAVPEPAES